MLEINTGKQLRVAAVQVLADIESGGLTPEVARAKLSALKVVAKEMALEVDCQRLRGMKLPKSGKLLGFTAS